MEMKKKKAVTDERILVMVPPHPLIKHWSSVLRNDQTLSTIFENALPKFGGLLIYEASREWLILLDGRMKGIKDKYIIFAKCISCRNVFWNCETIITPKMTGKGIISGV